MTLVIGPEFTAEFCAVLALKAMIVTTWPCENRPIRVCRGLEGWAAVNLRFDDFYEMKLRTFSAMSRYGRDNPGLRPGALSPPHLYADRRAPIPLTRAIDTLIIQVGKTQSVCAWLLILPRGSVATLWSGYRRTDPSCPPISMDWCG